VAWWCGLITSDAHEGLKAARLAVFGGVPWQRCQFHLQQNAQAYVPRKDMQAEVAEDIRTVFNFPRPYHRRSLPGQAGRKVSEDGFPSGGVDGCKYSGRIDRLRLPSCSPAVDPHEQYRRTTTCEVRRRTRVVSIFPNPASGLRLISAVLNEISDEWVTSNAYLTFQ